MKLLIDGFQNEKPNAEYLLALDKFCKAKVYFMAMLDEKQKAEYLKLDFVCGELDVVELNDFAEFLFKHINQQNSQY